MEKKYFVRGADSGIYYGEIVRRDDRETEMKNAYYVKSLTSVDMLYHLAMRGFPEPSLDKPVEDIRLTNTPFRTIITDTCEILCVTDEARESIEKEMPWTR